LVPGFTAMGFLGARVGLELSGRDLSLYELLAFLLLIGTAAGFAWFALRVVSVIQRRVELRYDEVTTEDRRGRRIKTQMKLIRRVLNTIIIIIAVSAILLSIPQNRRNRNNNNDRIQYAFDQLHLGFDTIIIIIA